MTYHNILNINGEPKCHANFLTIEDCIHSHMKTLIDLFLDGKIKPDPETGNVYILMENIGEGYFPENEDKSIEEMRAFSKEIIKEYMINRIKKMNRDKKREIQK